jgi:DNA polymerase I-like protein with 3'-5' exonuclease and polymerase domains
MDKPNPFPDLRNCTRVGVDIETRDDDLKKMGPGVRRDAFIAGVSVAYTQDGNTHSHYYPVRHKEGFNYPTETVMDYLRDNICDDRKEIVGANLLYDLDFLAEKDVHVKGKLMDVQVAEPLIDENKRGHYSLGDLSELYLGHGKSEAALYQWLAEHHGGKPTRSAQAGRIWMAPGYIAEEYACSDAENPLGIIHQQLEIIGNKKQDLTEVWELESDLQPMLLAMRRRGVRINEAGAKTASREMNARINELKSMLDDYDIIHTVAATIGEYCDARDIPYQLTQSTRQPQINEAFLSKYEDDPVLAAVAEVRKADKSSGTFISGLLKHMVNGRVHCQFNQLNSDQFGAVSGRFSSSNPNLQNIPARVPDMARLIRGLFEPEPGELWARSDYSQIEYRLLIEYAVREFDGLMGSQTMLDRFIEDPATDMHQAVGDLCGISRDDGKTINFGMVYGLGVGALMAKLGYPEGVCRDIIAKYHDMMPFAKELYNVAQNRASARGWVRTLGGRVRRFSKWEPWVPWQAPEGSFNERLKEWMKWSDSKNKWVRDLSNRPKSLREAEAQVEYEGLKMERSLCHTALNALLQGSAADIMKRSMVDIWQSGVCDVLGAPFLTVHDELNWSVPDTKEGREAFAESNRIMESVYADRLNIPLLVDYKLGNNWAECK